MVGVWHGFAMIAHEAGHCSLLMLAERGNIGVAHDVFAMLMVPARIHRDAHFVQKRGQFQRDPLRRGKLVKRRQLIEKLRRQPPHVFAMSRVGVHPRGKPARLLA